MEMQIRAESIRASTEEPRLSLCCTTPRPVGGCSVGSVSSLTCLRLYREVGLSLQNAVHQPGAVAVGGVISICRCHLHHWRTYGTKAQTRQSSQEMTPPRWFGSGIVWQTSMSQRICWFACLRRLNLDVKWKTLCLFSQTLQPVLHLRGRSPLRFLYISSLSGGETSALHFGDFPRF